MDASYKIQRGIHGTYISIFMCPDSPGAYHAPIGSLKVPLELGHLAQPSTPTSRLRGGEGWERREGCPRMGVLTGADLRRRGRRGAVPGYGRLLQLWSSKLREALNAP